MKVVRFLIVKPTAGENSVDGNKIFVYTRVVCVDAACMLFLPP